MQSVNVVKIFSFFTCYMNGYILYADVLHAEMDVVASDVDLNNHPLLKLESKCLLSNNTSKETIIILTNIAW